MLIIRRKEFSPFFALIFLWVLHEIVSGEENFPPPPGERTIVLPKTHGYIDVRPWGSQEEDDDWATGWKSVEQDEESRYVIPPRMEVRYVTTFRGIEDRTPLDALDPSAIQVLSIHQDVDLRPIVHALSKQQTLRLVELSHVGIDKDIIDEIGRMRGLRVFVLDRYGGTEIPLFSEAGLFASFRNHPNIRRLVGVPIDDPDTLSNIVTIPGLEELSGVAIDDDFDMAKLAGLKKLRRLRLVL